MHPGTAAVCLAVIAASSSTASTDESACWTDPAWTVPSTRPVRAFFFDLGVEVAQSTLLALGESPAEACRYAWGNPMQYQGAPVTDAAAKTDPWHRVCLNQNRRAAGILRSVHALAARNGADFSGASHAVVIEPNERSTPIIERVVAKYPSRVTAFSRSAATVGREGATLQYNQAAKSVDPTFSSRHMAKNAKAVAAAGSGVDQKQGVTTVNLMRVMSQLARADDFVVLKIDIEGSEYGMLPCLVASPAAALVDVLLLERHDRMLDKLSRRESVRSLDAAVAQLKARGVVVHQNWP